MLSKLKGLANKIKQKNQKAKEMQQQEDGVKKTLNQIKYFFFSIGIMAPIVGWGVVLIVSLMLLAGPVMLLGQFISGVIDAVTEFGTSVGNFFTSGCYGTDEECLEKELQKREIEFHDSIKGIYEVYLNNEGGGMENRLDKYEGTLTSNSSYSVALNTGLLVSALNYMDEPEANYFQLQQEELGCSRLIKWGLLSETNNECENRTGDTKKWYFQPSTEEEWNEKFADQIGINSDAIWNNVTGITEENPCGDYNSVYNSGIGTIYYEGENLWGTFVNWITGNDETNQLRMLAKNMVKRDVQSTCRVIKTCKNDDCEEYDYEKEITNSVYYYYDQEKFRNYLIDVHVPALLLEDYLFYQIDILRSDYEKDVLGETITTKAQEKKFLESIQDRLTELAADYEETTKTEKYKKEVEHHADTILDMASEFDEYSQDGQYLNGITFYQGSVGFKEEIIYFNQGDYANFNYGSYGTIKSHGCGPTSLSIAMSSLLGKSISPVDVTNWACSNGYCTSSGSYWSLITNAPLNWGLTSEEVGKDTASVQKVVDALATGEAFVVAIMGPGTFTSGGHFITLAGVNEDKQALVYDPASRTRTNQYFDLNMIVEQNRGSFWIIRRSEG